MKNISMCVIIPTLNHHKALKQIIETVEQHVLAIILIDDGSNAEVHAALQALAQRGKDVELLTHSANLGKGVALKTGLERATARGFTHALQVDADGQHDLDDMIKLLEAAQKSPDALITAKPVYDASMPLGRRIGRWITHIWVWVETLSFSITDSMCGFRIYPVNATLKVMDSEIVGKRMDFDTSIMVHLYWRGVDVIEIPSNVIYPRENTSNFDVVKDNILITQMHTRLVFGMLMRALTLRLRWKS